MTAIKHSISDAGSDLHVAAWRGSLALTMAAQRLSFAIPRAQREVCRGLRRTSRAAVDRLARMDGADSDLRQDYRAARGDVAACAEIAQRAVSLGMVASEDVLEVVRQVSRLSAELTRLIYGCRGQRSETRGALELASM